MFNGLLCPVSHFNCGHSHFSTFSTFLPFSFLSWPFIFLMVEMHWSLACVHHGSIKPQTQLGVQQCCLPVSLSPVSVFFSMSPVRNICAGQSFRVQFVKPLISYWEDALRNADILSLCVCVLFFFFFILPEPYRSPISDMRALVCRQ